MATFTTPDMDSLPVTNGTNTSSQSFDWAVNAVAALNSIDDQSNAAGDAVSLQVSASDTLNDTLTYAATNLPSGLGINSTSGLISGTIALGDDAHSPYAVTVTATDSAGNSATQSFNWTVAHVLLVNPGPLQNLDGASVSSPLQGSDADGDKVTYTASGLPSGLSINTSTGLISGTIASNADANSPYNVTLTAGDGTNTTTQTFLWTVSQVALALPSDQTNSEGDNVSLQLQGTASTGSLSYNVSGLPPGLSFNVTTGQIAGTLAAGDAANGPYTIDASASNGTVSTSQSFNWTVNPVVNLTTPADQSNKVGDSVSLQISATDSLHKTLSYSATGLPSGLSINSSSGLISGKISGGDPSGGPFVVTVTATDGTYNSSVGFNWNVTDTAVLTMTAPGTQDNVASDSVVKVQVTASDPDGDALTYSATNLPDGLSIDPSTGLISGTIAEDAPDSTPYQTTVTATDGNGQSVSQTFTWIVNAPPISAQSSPLNFTEGVDPGAFTIATFTTPDLNSLPDDFAAVIDYGDGTDDTGWISGGNGNFTVTTDHVYAEKGNYTISIQIFNGLTGAGTTTTTTATVSDGALTLTGGFESGDPMTDAQGGFQLAVLSDVDPGAPSSDYSVTVNWGDGTIDTNSPMVHVLNIGSGLFLISGSHSYANPWPNGVGPVTYDVSITVTDADGASASTTSTVVVGNIEPGLQATMGGWAFVDQNYYATPSDFVYDGQTGVALINWGDGTSSLGTITIGSGGNGAGPVTFSINAKHTYTQDSLDQPNGVDPITVTVTDDDGNTLQGIQYVSVVRPPMMQDTGNVLIDPSNLTVNNYQVAAFTVPDATDGTSEFAAQINWGDGTTSSGTVQEESPGLFQVLGSHTYAVYDWYTITATVSQDWGGTAAAAAGAALAGDKPVFLINRPLQSTKTLSVGAWTNSFDVLGTNVKFKEPPRNWNVSLNGAFFISDDPARFRVKVTDPVAARANNTITVFIQSTSDGGHEITLSKSRGVFLSQYLLLTTFNVDRTEGYPQTLNVRLGNTVSAIYDGQKAQATVPVLKTVKLHINILRVTPGGAAVAKVADVKYDVLQAKKVYAAAGIKLVIDGPINIVDPPAGLKSIKHNYMLNGQQKSFTFEYLKSGLLSHFIDTSNQNRIVMTLPEKILVGDRNLRNNNDINVYYVNYLAQNDGTSFKTGVGESFPVGLVPAQFANSLIIAENTEDNYNNQRIIIYQSLAHEIGHILLKSGDHAPPLFNLMYDPPRSTSGVFDSRRIIPDDAKKMRNNRLAK